MEVLSAPRGTDLAESCWRNRPYLSLLAGQFVSLLGSQFTFVALPWFVLSTTGSAARMTLVLVAETIPLAVLGAPAGAIVDRVNLKRLMVTLDVVRGFLMLVIPTMAALGRLEFWMIVVVAVFNGILVTPYLSARMAIVPRLVGEDERCLTLANTSLIFAMQITSVFGPALAGVLIGLLGNVSVLFIDAASFFVAAGIIWLGVPRGEDSGERERSHWLEDVLVGFRFIWSSPPIRTAILIGMFVNLGFAMLVSAALPVLVKQVLHGEAGDLGIILSVWGVGTTVGMASYGALSGRWPWRRGTSILVFTIGMVLPLWLLPLIPTLTSVVIGFGTSALFAGPMWVLIQTLLQVATPADVRGRVFAAFNALWLVVTPLGLAIAGPLLDAVGVMPVLWFVVVLLTVLALAVATLRKTRNAWD